MQFISFFLSLILFTLILLLNISTTYFFTKNLEKFFKNNKILYINFLIFLSISFQIYLVFISSFFISTKSFFINIFYTLFGFIYIKKTIKLFKKIKIKKIYLIFPIISILPMVFNFSYIKDNLYIQDWMIHDGFWHIALIKNLTNSIPPLHPSISEEIYIKNYHYFLDLFLSFFVKNYFFNVVILFFKITPIFISFLFFLNIYNLLDLLKIKNKFISFYIFFFSGSFAYLLGFLHKNWNESSFWVSQTFVMWINPQLIFSFSILIFLLNVFLFSLNNKKINKYFLFLLSFIIATSIGFKSYSYILLSILYAFLLLCILIKKYINIKDFVYISFIFLLINLPILVLLLDFKKSFFIYHPLWFTTTMFNSTDRINIKKIELLEQFYLYNKLYFKFFILKAFEIVIFFIGNLGIRSLIFIFPFFLKKQNLKKQYITIVYILFFISSIFPLLFIQKGIVWNSIQFFYYSLILSDIITILVLEKINIKKYILYIFIITISIPTYIKTLNNVFLNFRKIPKKQIEKIKNIRNKKIAICYKPGDLYYDTSFVKSFTENSKVFLADRVQLLIVGINYSKKEEQLRKAFSNKQNLDNFIKQENISFIICNDNDKNIFLNKYKNYEKINKTSFIDLK